MARGGESKPKFYIIKWNLVFLILHSPFFNRRRLQFKLSIEEDLFLFFFTFMHVNKRFGLHQDRISLDWNKNNTNGFQLHNNFMLKQSFIHYSDRRRHYNFWCGLFERFIIINFVEFRIADEKCSWSIFILFSERLIVIIKKLEWGAKRQGNNTIWISILWNECKGCWKWFVLYTFRLFSLFLSRYPSFHK